MTSLNPSNTQKLRIFALWILLFLPALAYDEANDALPTQAVGVVTFNGTSQRTSGNIKTYNIPVDAYPSTLEVNLRGGDGGYAQSGKPVNPTNQASKGGGGILGTAKFSIHPSNAGALRPGGEIRLIVGNKGFNRQSGIYAHAASSGGGGSGLIYKGPLDSDDWQPLIIAGGGGGAYASTVTGKRASNRNGGNGLATENGGNGGGASGHAGGGSSDGGNSGSWLGGGGGGWSYGGDQAGGGAGNPLGGSGGVMNVNTDKGAHGGFGCGGGGDGGKATSVSTTYMSGGGGGGYSGGGGGAHTYGGGGGGSFLVQASSGIAPVADSTSWTPRGAGLLLNGFVSLETSGSTSPANVMPTITANPVVVDFSAIDSYVDSGVTAQDYYGNSLNVTVTFNNVNRAASGDYEVKYEAFDDFGQKATATRIVTVRLGSYRPTFNLISALKVNQVGDQTHLVATNFSANWLGFGDAGFEEFVGYEIKANSNSSMFETQPSIDTNGNLNFKPNVGTIGSSILTITAFDNGPDPSVIESLSKQIEIQVNIAPSAPQFVLASNPEVLGTSVDFSEGASSLIVGTVKSSDPDSQNLTYVLLNSLDKDRFTLDPSSGFLTFKAQPNYEAPNDNGGNRIYDIQVNAGDGNTTAVSNLIVNLLDAPEPPSIPVLSNNSVPENDTTVGVVSSTDPEGTALTYAISTTNGADSNKFKIHANTGLLEFNSPPDYENPDDTGGDRVYNLVVVATSGGDDVSKAFSVTVTNVPELPTVPVLSSLTILENQTVVGIASSTDSDGSAVGYAISATEGADRDEFTINSSTGLLEFKEAPNYENPDDAGTDHFYDLVVIASSGGDSISQAFSIEVTDVNEKPTTPILSNSSIPENQTEIGTVSSTDPDGTEVSYAISNLGVDSDKFKINSSTGLLEFISAPDYENPTNEGETDAYELIVIASSGGQSTSEFFAITVTDVDRGSSVPALDNSIVIEGSTFVGTVTSEGSDGEIVTFSLSSL